MKLLLVTDCRFWLRNRGGYKRIDALVRFLADAGFVVGVFFIGELSLEEQEAVRETVHGGELFFSGGEGDARPRRRSGALHLLRRLRRNASLQDEPRVADFKSAHAAASFETALSAYRPDWIFVERVHLTYLLDHVKAVNGDRPRFAIDTIDILHSRAGNFHAYGEAHWVGISRREEQRLLRRYDLVVAIQNEEAEQLSAMLPRKKIVVAGHAPDIDASPLPGNEKITVSYIATGGAANRAALRSFLADVWPTLYAQHPQTSLLVVGSICSAVPELVNVPGCECAGEVDDLAEVYPRTDIVVNPVIFGGGLKIKNVEALAAGKPLVTTAVGAEGLLLGGTEEPYMICDSAAEQLEALSELVLSSERREALALRAGEYARAHLSAKAAYGELVEALKGGC